MISYNKTFILQRGKYFTSPTNLVELSCFVIACVYILPSCDCKVGYNPQIGAVAMFLGWINLILYLRRCENIFYSSYSSVIGVKIRYEQKCGVVIPDCNSACTKTRNTGKPRNTPEHSGTHRNTPEHPGTLRNTPEHPGTLRNTPNPNANPSHGFRGCSGFQYMPCNSPVIII